MRICPRTVPIKAGAETTMKADVLKVSEDRLRNRCQLRVEGIGPRRAYRGRLTV
jgi:hypothetical protein